MFRKIENRINEILSGDSSIDAKRLAVKHAIDEISKGYISPTIDGRVRRAALNTYENYQWPKEEKQPFPKFEVFSAVEWDELVREARSLLYHNLDDLPNGTSKVISDDIDKGRIIKRNFRVEKDFYCSELEYDIKCNSSKRIFFITTEKRTLKGGETQIFINHCNLIYQNGKVITEILCSTDENNPNVITSRRLYVDGKMVLEEFCNTESNNLSFLSDEISFIQKMDIIDTQSPVFQNAVKNSLNYFYHTYGEYEFNFGVGPINNIFNYTISVVANNKRIYIYGNTKEVKISVYSTKPSQHEQLNYEEFVKGNENSEAVKKVEEVILKLQKLGVSIIYTKGEETKLYDKQSHYK